MIPPRSPIQSTRPRYGFSRPSVSELRPRHRPIFDLQVAESAAKVAAPMACIAAKMGAEADDFEGRLRALMAEIPDRHRHSGFLDRLRSEALRQALRLFPKGPGNE